MTKCFVVADLLLYLFRMKVSSLSKKSIVLIGLIVSLFVVLGGVYSVFLSPVLPEKNALKEATRDQSEVTLLDGVGYYKISAVAKDYSSEPSEYHEAEKIGIVYYPGGRVDSRAYAYKLKQVVADYPNIVIFVVKPFMNFAFFAINAADTVRVVNYDIERWYVAGHSLGGAMACQYAAANSDKVEGLLLFGAYCATDISQSKLKVMSLLGSVDGLVTAEKNELYSKNLPNTTQLFEIEGANHAQMGNYGWQKGDNYATVSDEIVTESIVRAVGDFLQE